MITRMNGRKAWTPTALLVGCFALAACQATDPEPSTTAIFADSPRPADRVSYPNLSTVPPRPEGLPTPEERARIREQLERDRIRLHDAMDP